VVDFGRRLLQPERTFTASQTSTSSSVEQLPITSKLSLTAAISAVKSLSYYVAGVFGIRTSTPRLAHVPWTPPYDESLDESLSETPVLGTAAKASTFLAGLPSRPLSAYFLPVHSIRLVGYCRLCRSPHRRPRFDLFALLTFQAHSFSEIPHRARLVGAISNCNRSLMLASSNAKS